MQAIILAAGFGSRLRPLTDHMPKCLTEVNGTPLLVNALNLIAEVGIEEVILVVGHMSEKIVETIGFEWNGMKITYIENTIYRDTNNVYSLYLTKNYIRGDALLLECDLYYESDLIHAIISGNADCNILVSLYNPITMNGTVVSVAKDMTVSSLTIGKKQGADFDYTDTMKTVNVYKFKQHFLMNQFLPAIELYVHTQQMKSYYELVLGSLIYFSNAKFLAIGIDESRWAEVDDLEDLHRAERQFAHQIMQSSEQEQDT